MRTEFSIKPNTEYCARVPYPASKSKSEGLANLGYFDLCIEPHRKVEIHELTDYPEWSDLIDLFIGSDRVMRSIRCDTARNHLRNQQFPCSEFAHLTIAFTKLQPYTDPDYYREIYDEYCSRGQSLSDLIHTRFWVIPLLIDGLNRIHCCLDIWHYGLGKTDEEARNNWKEGVKVLKSVFETFLQEPKRLGRKPSV